jgi:mRNA interferase MazF
MGWSVKRGEVRWYQFQPPDKNRPVLILTRDVAIAYLNEVTVAPITSTIRDIPSEVILGPEDGMDRECSINFDHIQTISKIKLGRLITTLSAEKLAEVGPAICFALGLDELLSDFLRKQID